VKIIVGVSVATILRAAVWNAVEKATPNMEGTPGEKRERRIPMVDAAVRACDRWVDKNHLLRVVFDTDGGPSGVTTARVLEA